MSCNMLSLKRFMHVAVNASSREIRVGLTSNDYNELIEYQLITIYSWIFIVNCDLITENDNL